VGDRVFRVRKLVLILCWLAACGGAQVRPTVAVRFELRSSLLVNLHHQLYAEARRSRGLAPATNETPAGLSAEEQKVWDDCVAWYGRELAEKDLLFDADLRELGHQIVAEKPVGPIAEVLGRARVIYEKRQWPAQDRRNRALLDSLRQADAQLGLALSDELSRAYQTGWPQPPIRVDVTGYAGRVGAYTTVRPPHIVMAASDPRHQGTQGIEILFHEASHTLIARITALVASEAARTGKKPPADLWHALVFYTTGEIVRRKLPGHVPYADANDLWTRGNWTKLKPLFERTWLPYLDGKIGFDDALRNLVAGL
jgi:hypothetical protein